MSVYHIVLAIILILSYPLCVKNPTKAKKTAYVAVVFSALFLISGLRYGIGESYGDYYRLYTEIADSSVTEVFKHNLEPGFVMLTLLLSYLPGGFAAVNLAYSFVILLPIALVIRKHSANIWLSCCFYVCASLFFASMEFTRQAIAASLILSAFGSIKKREHIPVIFMTIIAALFHISALVFLPVYLATLVKPAKRFYIALGLFAIEFYVLFEPFLNSALAYMSKKNGEDYGVYAETLGTGVFEPFFILLPAVVCAVLLLSYIVKWQKNDELALFYVIMSFAGLFVWILTSKTVLAERFGYYFTIFSVLGVSSATHYFTGDFSDVVTVIDSVFGGLKNRLKNSRENGRRVYLRPGRGKFYLMFCLFLAFCVTVNVMSLDIYANGDYKILPYNTIINRIEHTRQSFSENKIAELKSETDLRDYLIKLKNPDFSFIMTAVPDETLIITEATASALAYIGIRGELLEDGGFEKRFVAVGERGEIIYKNIDRSDINYLGAQICEYSADVISREEYSGIEIGGVNYALNDSYGLNITVFLDETGVIVDKINYGYIDGAPLITRTPPQPEDEQPS